MLPMKLATDALEEISLTADLLSSNIIQFIEALAEGSKNDKPPFKMKGPANLPLFFLSIRYLKYISLIVKILNKCLLVGFFFWMMHPLFFSRVCN